MTTTTSGRCAIPERVPTIVCLCGLTRFMPAFHEANRRETLAGRIVLTVGVVAHDGAGDLQRVDPVQKAELDELHLRKIDLADEIVVLNVGGYVGDVGESTRREVAYAQAIGTPVRWLQPPGCSEGPPA